MLDRIYPREKYLSRIRPFYDSDIVKVITGVRRCGKSCLLRSIMAELKGKGAGDRIIYLPLDKRGFRSIETPDALEKAIEERALDDGPHYLFIDEVQNVKGFEKIVLEFEEEGYSIFLTGSNSYLLSEEISTKLTGRYLNFETYPLDFLEFEEMKRFFGKDIKGDIYEEFQDFLLFGGFPKSLEFEEPSAKMAYERGVVSEIIQKDVRSRNRISNAALFERVLSCLLNNYASPFSLKSFCLALEKQGLCFKQSTVKNYIDFLTKAKIVYECNRFDLKSKRSLAREQKYYLSDLSFYFSSNVDNRLNYGPSLENVVFLYLLGQGYQVSVGKIGGLEIDFILRKQDGDYAYLQVAYSLQGSDEEARKKIQEREYRPFRSIKDGYPRYILSLDRYLDQREGVRHLNIIDLFLGKVSL